MQRMRRPRRLDDFSRRALNGSFLKVCSTFDSQAQGNIGPPLEVLLDELHTECCIINPAFPENGRTAYMGYLFVDGVLLSESSMKDHPLTPMNDSKISRLMEGQLSRRRRIAMGAITYHDLAQGKGHVPSRLRELRGNGQGIVVADSITDSDLDCLGHVALRERVVVGSAGLVRGMGKHLIGTVPASCEKFPVETGYKTILSGSCSVASNVQVENFKAAGGSAYYLEPIRLVRGEPVLAEITDWVKMVIEKGPVMIYATSSVDKVKLVQEAAGVDGAGSMIEDALAQVARSLVCMGVKQMVIAGGETSGAVVQALGVDRLTIGPQIDPGVPWCHAPGSTSGAHGLNIALKSGNFGAPEFFNKAFDILEAQVD